VSLRLRITRRAAAQIETAAAWWMQHRPLAPHAFTDDLEAAFDLLLRQPGAGTPIANVPLVGVRRLNLGRIRYYLYYRAQQKELVVLALWHTSRRGLPPL